MKIKKWHVLLAAAAVIAVIVLIQGIMKMRGLYVAAAAVQSGLVEDYYTEEGTLSFGQEYTIVAKVSGPVKEVMVQENSLVKAGDVLFVIDNRDIQYEKSLYESTLLGLRAQLEQSRINQLETSSPQEYLNSLQREMEARAAEYQSAKTVYEGSAALYSEGSISKVEFEQNKASYEAAQAAWQQAKERYNQSQELLLTLGESGIDENCINTRFYNSAIEALKAEIQSNETSAAQIEDKLKDCVIAADRDGIVKTVPVENMSIIQEGSPAVVISSYGRAEVKAEVLTSIAPYLSIGDPVTVTLQLRGKDSVYQGQISEVYDFASQGTSALGLDEYRVQVKAEMEAAQELEKMNGYDVTVRFQLYSGADKLWVPASAVFRTDGADYVFIIQGGRAVKTPVEIEYQTSTQAVITAGLETGVRVIKNADEEGIYDGAKVYE